MYSVVVGWGWGIEKYVDVSNRVGIIGHEWMLSKSLLTPEITLVPTTLT